MGSRCAKLATTLAPSPHTHTHTQTNIKFCGRRASMRCTLIVTVCRLTFVCNYCGQALSLGHIVYLIYVSLVLSICPFCWFVCVATAILHTARKHTRARTDTDTQTQKRTLHNRIKVVWQQAGRQQATKQHVSHNKWPSVVIIWNGQSGLPRSSFVVDIAGPMACVMWPFGSVLFMFLCFFFFIYILCRELIKSNISCNPNTNYSKYEWEFVLHSLLIIDVLCLFDNQFLIFCLRTVFVRPTNAHTACDRIRSLEYIFKRAYKYQTQTYVHLICFTYMAGCCRHIYSTHINAFVPPVEYGNMYLYVWLVIRSACC